MVTLFSCNEKPAVTIPQKTKKTLQKESKYLGLLQKFEPISIDTLKVFSSYDFDNFKGQAIDNIDVALFPKEIADNYSTDSPNLFACYKFPLDATRIGLIARTPGEYDSTSIKLFVYDSAKDTLSNFIELADIFGDAGDAMEKTSWLFKNDHQKIQAIIWVQQSYDHSVEDINDTIVESWENHYLIDLSKIKFDTMNRNSEELAKKFKKILK